MIHISIEALFSYDGSGRSIIILINHMSPTFSNPGHYLSPNFRWWRLKASIPDDYPAVDERHGDAQKVAILECLQGCGAGGALNFTHYKHVGGFSFLDKP